MDRWGKWLVVGLTAALVIESVVFGLHIRRDLRHLESDMRTIKALKECTAVVEMNQEKLERSESLRERERLLAERRYDACLRRTKDLEQACECVPYDLFEGLTRELGEWKAQYETVCYERDTCLRKLNPVAE